MWNAIKGDILDFVSTIKQDVVALVNIEELEQEAKSQRINSNKSAADIANSRATFTEVLIIICSLLCNYFICFICIRKFIIMNTNTFVNHFVWMIMLQISPDYY